MPHAFALNLKILLDLNGHFVELLDEAVSIAALALSFIQVLHAMATMLPAHSTTKTCITASLRALLRLSYLKTLFSFFPRDARYPQHDRDQKEVFSRCSSELTNYTLSLALAGRGPKKVL
jgi:hypothetical protein